MTPQYQTIQGQGNSGVIGDCFRCCIASMLDLNAVDVPHFHADGGKRGGVLSQDAIYLMRLWMGQRGMYYVEFGFRDKFENVIGMMGDLYPHLTHIMMGRNADGFAHSVVCRNGLVIHDPAGAPPQKVDRWESHSLPPQNVLRSPMPDMHYRVGIIAKNL